MTEYQQIDIAVKYKKSPISVITYSHELHFLAIGRSSGIVEILDFKQNFLLLAKIIVSNNNSIDGLKFMKIKNEVKLFGISAFKLFEIDLSKNYLKQEIFCFNNNCARSIIQAADRIVIGCDGGYIHFFEYVSEIKFMQTIHIAEESIFSLAYSELVPDSIFAGTPGKLYKVNLQTNNTQYYNTTDEKNKIPTTYWCLEFVGKYLCSGDNNGQVTIWNTETLGVIKCIRTHQSQILAISPGHNCLYASGSDPEIVKLELADDSFQETGRRFGVKGDVRSLCSTETKLIIGGQNCTLFICDINNKMELISDVVKEIPSAMPTNEVHHFKEFDKHILFCELNKSITVYEIGTKPLDRILLRTIKPPNESHIQAWSASKCLRYLAYSTNLETRILKMCFSVNGKSSASVELKRFNAAEFNSNYKPHGPGVVLPASYLLKYITMGEKTFLVLMESFVIDSKSDNNSKLLIYEMAEDCPMPLLRATIIAKEQNYFNGVHQLEASDDGKYIAFSTLDGLLYIYSLEKLAILKKVSQQLSNNKKEVQRVVCMRFNPSSTQIAVVYTNNKIWEMDFSKKTSSKWNNIFNANMRKEWAQIIPRQIMYLSKRKIACLTNKKLLVQIDMKKEPLVPANVPLFTKKKNSKESKQRSIFSDVAALRRKIRKMKRYEEKIKAENDLEALKVIEKRTDIYQKRIDKLTSLQVDSGIETCFTWTFLTRDTAALKYMSNEKLLISVSIEDEEQQTFSFKKKQFGSS